MTSDEIVNLIVSQKSDEKKLELIDKYAKDLDNSDLITAIASLKDVSLLTQTLIKYNLINNAEQVQNISDKSNDSDDTVEDNTNEDKSNINDEEIMKYIKEHIEDLTVSELEDNIVSMKDINNIITIIDDILKYQSELFDIGSIIAKRDNDDDKIKLVEKYAFEIDNMFEIWASLKDKTREVELINAHNQKPDEEIIKYIEEHNSPQYGWIGNLTDDNNKIKLIEKYANKMDEYTLTKVILSINDKDEMFKTIDKNKNRIIFEDIAYHFARRKEENDRLEIMNKYADEIRDAIDSVEDEADKAELKNIYNINNTKDESDKNNSNDNKVEENSSINDDNIIKYIEEHDNELTPEDLGNYIGTIKDINKTKEMINKYIDQLKSIGILYVIKEKEIDEDKVELIKEYKDTLGKTNLWGAIKTISDPNLREEIRKTVKVNKVDNNKEAKKARRESKEKKKRIKKEKTSRPKGKLKVSKTAIAIFGGGVVVLTGIVLGSIAIIKHAEKDIRKDDLSSNTKKIVVDDSSNIDIVKDDSSLRKEIEDEISSFIYKEDSSVLDNSDKIEDDSSELDSSSMTDSSSNTDSSEPTVIELTDNSSNSPIEETVTYDNEYFVAPDGSLWTSEEEYNKYVNNENQVDYETNVNSESEYFVAPDGTLWTSEDDYNEYMKYNSPDVKTR